jgi:TPP-dependent pyruvate/acetoin dehydrogenase alpha subunit
VTFVVFSIGGPSISGGLTINHNAARSIGLWRGDDAGVAGGIPQWTAGVPPTQAPVLNGGRGAVGVALVFGATPVTAVIMLSAIGDGAMSLV